MTMLTVRIEFPRDLFQLRDATKVGGQLLDVSSIESLT